MVAPVRCATPGTDVDWAIKPWLSANATIQSISTPPPCPPIARIATEIGLLPMGTMGVSAFMRSDPSAERDPASVATALEKTDHRGAHACQEPIKDRRVMNDVGAIKRGTEHRGFRHLTAIAATDAGVIDRCDRIVLQRVRGVLHRQRRAAGQPDARVVAGADVFINAEAFTHHALAVLHRLAEQR